MFFYYVRSPKVKSNDRGGGKARPTDRLLLSPHTKNEQQKIKIVKILKTWERQTRERE
jgi:hypothetical protein